jgi:hypothetical protein
VYVHVFEVDVAVRAREETPYRYSVVSLDRVTLLPVQPEVPSVKEGLEIKFV